MRPSFKEILNILISNRQQPKDSNNNNNNNNNKEEDPLAFLPWRIEFGDLYVDQQSSSKVEAIIDKEEPVGRGNFANVYK
jgi:hypothetical protein